MFEAIRRVRKGRGDLFDRIGRFLEDQALDATPANYTLAHATLSDPDGPLARMVAQLTEGGVRLNRREIEELGGTIQGLSLPEDRCADDEQARALVAETQAKVDDFAEMMRAIHAETQGFGRDLAATAATIGARPSLSAQDLARLAAAMVARTRDAEDRLAQATHEAEALRAKLAEARDTARRDALTGLPNRRAFDEAFEARDQGRGPWNLAICDVDHFKRLNDSHGHPVGDRVLRAIAESLTEACEGQLVARYGGEEFAILIGGLAPVEAADLVEHVRVSVAAKRFRNRDTDAQIGKVSISIGLTQVQRLEGIASAFDRADRLLYTAKAQGRDRVCAG